MAPTAGWSDLHSDPLDAIAHRLDLFDFTRFSAVCSSWRSAATAHRRHCPSHLKTLVPWLLLPSRRPGDVTDPHTRRFHILTDQSTHPLPLPAFAGADRCIGSSDGHLISVDSSAADLHVINPLTGAHFPLPRTSTLTGPASMWDPHYMRNNYFNKATWTPAAAAVVFSYRERLAFAKRGHSAWTELDWPVAHDLDDVIFHNGRVHAVSEVETLVFDLDRPLDPPVSLPDPLEQEGIRYLAESVDGDELILIIRKFKRRDPHRMATGFMVFKLDEDQGQWNEVESFGDQALFLGHNSLFVRPTSWLFPVVARNCIYFTDNFEDCGGIGVFDLRDGSITRLDVSFDLVRLNWPQPLWFTPSLI